MDQDQDRKKYDLSDGIEVAVVLMTFIFALVFMIRISEGTGIKDQFLVQNGANLLVASILSVFIMGLFMARVDKTRLKDLGYLRPYALGGGMTGIAAYLLAMFDLSSEMAWLCLVLGFLGLVQLTVHSIRANSRNEGAGAYRFMAGMWTVMIISSAVGLDFIQTSSIAGLLLFVALGGALVGVFGLLEIIDDHREAIDRFGYSASVFCILMVWLSTSRIAASGTATGYTEVDGILVGTGAVFGMLGATVLAQRRYLDSRIRHAIAHGHDDYKEGEYKGAVERYDEALEVDPKSMIARTCKADALAQLKRYDDAIRIYDSVIMDDKEYNPAISGKGSALRQKGDLAKSIIYLQRALNIDPDSKTAWNNKGNAFFFLDQLKTSIFCYKKAIELDPNYSGAWYNMAVAFTNSGNFLEADHAFRTATNLLERKKRPILEVGARTDGRKDSRFKELLLDRPQDISLELLAGDMEKKVLSHISFNPGVTYKDVTKSLNLGEAEAKAVLAGLTRSHLIDSKRDGTRFRYYPREHLPVKIHVMEMEDGSISERDVRYLTDLQKRMVELIDSHRGITSKELVAELDMSEQVIGFHLKTLKDGGIIDKRRDGLGTVYFLK